MNRYEIEEESPESSETVTFCKDYPHSVIAPFKTIKEYEEYMHALPLDPLNLDNLL